jgi:hypothetical protein
MISFLGSDGPLATHGKFHSSALDTNDKFSQTFSTAGTVEYYCAIHPKMTGKIVVTPWKAPARLRHALDNPGYRRRAGWQWGSLPSLAKPDTV